MGRFNNYVTLKLPFLIHLSPIITLCHVCSREPSCVTSGSAQTISSFPIKNEVSKMNLKRVGVEIKKSLSPFIWFFFQLSTNNTKRIIYLKSKTCHYCHSLVETGSILSSTKFLFSWIFFFSVSLLLFENELECFEIFSHIFPYWKTFYNSYLSVFTQESCLALTNSWWSCDIFLLISFEDSLFQEHVLKAHSINIRM